MLNRLRSFVSSILRRRDLEDEMSSEMRFHIDTYAADLERGGMTAQDARRRARAAFGGLESTKEAGRAARRSRAGSWFQAVLGDARNAVRSIRASTGFAAIAVLTLGTGLALATTVLTVLNAYVLRSMPYPHADRLYQLEFAEPGQRSPDGLARVEWTALSDVSELPVSWDLDVFYMTGGSFPEATQGAWITPGYVEGLAVRAALGRTLDARDFNPASPPVALISHRLWQSRFHGDPAVVGKTFTAYVSDRPDEAETMTIVGVLPASHWHFNPYTDVLAPLRAPTVPYIVRLQPGVSSQSAVERISSHVRQTLATLPATWRIRAVSMQDRYIADARPMLWSVSTGALLILLIASANVAVLLLVRGRRRQKELAIRLALGAGRTRLVRMLAIEGGLLAAAATLIGLAGGHAATGAIASSVESFVGRSVPGGVAALTIDGTVLLVAASYALLVVTVFTVVPLLTFRASRLTSALGQDRSGTDTRATSRTRSVLIGVEVAASLTLISGAALVLAAAMNMMRVDFGVTDDPVAIARLSLRQRSYPDAAGRAAFFERASAALSGVAGASAVGLSSWWPLQQAPPQQVRGNGSNANWTVSSPTQAVSTGYFAVLGITLRDGRAFQQGDTTSTEPVVIVSAALARRFWPGGRGVGESIAFLDDGGSVSSTRRVVGIVNDVRQTHADEDLFDAYVPMLQQPGRSAFVYLREPQSASWYADVRDAIGSIDSETATGAPGWLAEILDRERSGPRFLAELLTVFATVASVFALLGLHGVIAYAVRQRQREVAIRMAVGADPHAVTRLFIGQGLVVLGGGVLAGVFGAIALGRLLQNYLPGVRPFDVPLLAFATVAFGVCGLAAIWWPAWRAAAIDPAVALRE